MKILFDTNIIVDIWKKDPEFFENSFASLDICAMRKWDACISATQVPDLEYLFLARKIVDREAIHRAMEQVFSLFDIADVAECDCLLAHESQTKQECSGLDLEDGIIVHSAIRHGVNLMVTRDERLAQIAQKGFPELPVVSPADFVEAFAPANVSYELISVPEGA